MRNVNLLLFYCWIGLIVLLFGLSFIFGIGFGFEWVYEWERWPPLFCDPQTTRLCNELVQNESRVLAAEGFVRLSRRRADAVHELSQRIMRRRNKNGRVKSNGTEEEELVTKQQRDEREPEGDDEMDVEEERWRGVDGWSLHGSFHVYSRIERVAGCSILLVLEHAHRRFGSK